MNKINPWTTGSTGTRLVTENSNKQEGFTKLFSIESAMFLFCNNVLFQSNYNRANGVAVCACVWQPTHKTADVTVTKIAGYVRVRIIMNR